MYTAVQGTPIVVDLIQAAKNNGWSIDGTTASHEICNSGKVTLLTYPLIAGHVYQVSYAVLSISGGLVRMDAGTATGIARTTVGFYTETITVTGTSPVITFYSNANCQVQAFNISDTITSTAKKQRNTIVYSAKSQKWTDFRTLSPDMGFSLFINTYTLNKGRLYNHDNSSNNSRNNFYGVQYDSIIKFVENKNPAIVKSFESLSMQVNELMITTTDGITTSLGQVSELIAVDFLKDTLADGVTSIDVYSKEGVYSAQFLRNKLDDLILGEPLKGNWQTIELTTVDGSLVLKLFTVAVVSSISKIGAR